MWKYFLAENMKFRRTFTKKLVILMPLGTLFLTLILAMNFFQANAFNWWYALMMPGYIALIAALCDQKDAKKLGYRAVVALPVSLKKVWLAKILNLALYSFVADAVIACGVLLGGLVVAKPMAVSSCILGALIIFLTSLWMIPFSLLLANKFGMVATILIQVAGAIVPGIFFVDKAYWMVCPFSYTVRAATPVLEVLPNGTLAAAGDPLLNPSCLPIAIVLSIVLFAVITALTTVWFSKKEAK